MKISNTLKAELIITGIAGICASAGMIVIAGSSAHDQSKATSLACIGLALVVFIAVILITPFAARKIAQYMNDKDRPASQGAMPK